MSKPKDYEAIRARVNELEERRKAKKIAPDERFELEKKKEELRRHDASIQLKALREEMKAAKRDALIRILDTHGIETENALKDILKFVAKAKPELIPKMPEPETDGGGEAAATDAGEPEPENAEGEKNDAGEIAAADSKSEPPTCENCGAQLVRKQAKDGHYFLGCPNWKRGETHSSLDIDAGPEAEQAS